MPYIAISHSAGETTVQVLSKAELRVALNDGSLGELFFDKRPTDLKPQDWGGKVLILNAEIVTPTPVTRVVNWAVP